MGKSTIMAIFNSYVSLSEGNGYHPFIHSGLGPVFFPNWAPADAARGSCASSSSGAALVDVICRSQDGVVIIVVVLARNKPNVAGSAGTTPISSTFPRVLRIVM